MPDDDAIASSDRFIMSAIASLNNKPDAHFPAHIFGTSGHNMALKKTHGRTPWHAPCTVALLIRAQLLIKLTVIQAGQTAAKRARGMPVLVLISPPEDMQRPPRTRTSNTSAAAAGSSRNPPGQSGSCSICSMSSSSKSAADIAAGEQASSVNTLHERMQIQMKLIQDWSLLKNQS